VLWWPSDDDWAMRVPADLLIDKEPYSLIGTVKENSQRILKWTNIYYDRPGKFWLYTGGLPIDFLSIKDFSKEHLATISHGFMLEQLITSLKKKCLSRVL
jgi:hypothetical protein